MCKIYVLFDFCFYLDYEDYRLILKFIEVFFFSNLK